MSINRYKEHIFVLPEDEANSQIAYGFLLNPNLNSGAIDVLLPAGGWGKVLEEFREVHIPEMLKFTKRIMVLLMDFDQKMERSGYVKSKIPSDLAQRVFVLGVFSEPEELRSDLNLSFEKIGETLAKECAENRNELWGHELLKHNQPELERMISSVKPFLFSSL